MSNDIDDKFIEYNNLIGADLDVVDERFLISHKVVRGSIDLIITVPGGSGYCCFINDPIGFDDLIIPTNLISMFYSKDISSCVFNSCTELPKRYTPQMPLDKNNSDDASVEKHYQQIKAVVEHYSKSYDRIWMLGHSSSATTMIGMMKWWPDFEKHLAGLILLAPKKIFKDPNKEYIPHFGKYLSIPILSVNHEFDGAVNCPSEFNRMISRCSRDPRSRHVVLSGGIPDGDNDPSLGFGYHGFRGIEEVLVKEIVDFVQDNKIK